MTDAPTRVMLADDDADIRMFLEVTLGLAGFEVESHADGRSALEAARADPPDVMLLDVMMPRLDGLATTRALRADPRTSDVPIILVTAKALPDDKVLGLAEGADDYVTKPFDGDELVARIRAALRRSAAMRQVSPLTGLPGNPRIEAELERRLATGESFSLLYCDLNRFKAYNDHYGFLEGDAVLRALGRMLVHTVAEASPTDAFVGHVGGDDFVVITDDDCARELAATVCERFDALAPSFYDDQARARGHITVTDRRGDAEEVPFVSVDIGVACADPGQFSHPGELVTRATEMKRVAKRRGGGVSTFAVDRRGA